MEFKSYPILGEDWIAIAIVPALGWGQYTSSYQEAMDDSGNNSPRIELSDT